MQIYSIPVNKITNPNVIMNEESKKYIEEIAAEVRIKGQIDEIIVNEDNQILSGRYLFEACKKLGILKVKAIIHRKR